ncbi:unnamed protein product, partial [Heterotrigona itama]
RVNLLKICCTRFLRTEPYKTFYKTSMNEDALFKILDLLTRWMRPKNYNNIIH